MTKQLLVVGLVSLATVAHAEEKGDQEEKDRKYTLADLKALAEQKAYLEVVQHLGDVPPAARTSEWVELAGTASAGAIAAADKDHKLGFMLEIEKTYPIVLKSPKYIQVRTDAARPAFDACFGRRRSFLDCRDVALKFVDADVKNARLTLDVAKAVRLGMAHYGSLPFFARAHAAAAGKAATVCRDDDFKLAVISGLGLPDGDDRLGDAIALAYACWDDVKPTIVKELTEESGHYHDRACDILASKRASLPPDKEKLCAAPRTKK